MIRSENEQARRLDGYLVACARAGDRRAFEALARRWNRRLLAHGWRLTGDRDAAAEAVQAGWVEISRGLDRLQDEAAFAAWAYRIVTRRCARVVRGNQADRRLAAQYEIEAVSETGAGPGDDLVQAGEGLDRARLRAAIRDLPGIHRAAIALFYFEDLSIAEVAVALNVPAGTVKTRLMHGRRLLRSALKGNDDA